MKRGDTSGVLVLNDPSAIEIKRATKALKTISMGQDVRGMIKGYFPAMAVRAPEGNEGLDLTGVWYMITHVGQVWVTVDTGSRQYQVRPNMGKDVRVDLTLGK